MSGYYSRSGGSNEGFGRSLNVEFCWNCGNTCHLKKNCRTLKKNEEQNNEVANAVTDEVQDALILSVDSSIDSWVLDLGAFFRTIAHHEILENFIAGNNGKVYLADIEPLDVVGVGDVKLKMTNGCQFGKSTRRDMCQN